MTKNELRGQQRLLTQLEKYLPTLRLKKAMLQTEVNEVRAEILRFEEAFHQTRLHISRAAGLLTEKFGVDLTQVAKVVSIEKRYENIAGVDLPFFEKVTFAPLDYPLFSTPPWLDAAVQDLQKLATAKIKVLIEEEKKEALERELREVTIRVNLFEKNLIPRAQRNIKKIKVFIGDQELAAISQAKVAKKKIEAKES